MTKRSLLSRCSSYIIEHYTVDIKNYNLYGVSYVRKAGSHVEKRSQAEEILEQCAEKM